MLMSADATRRPIQKVAAIVAAGCEPPGPPSGGADRSSATRGPSPGWPRTEPCRRAPMAGAARAEPGRGPHPAPAPGTEGLPRAFLQSLRTLFDILDDRRRGFVHLREIESRWQGTDARELPRGVLEGLRQVAPASGYLTFERFVAGLRTSLLSADGGTRAPARAPARGGCPARPGGQPPPPPPPPPQRLVFAPADEPRTVLERKPLPLGARPTPAGPGGAARSLEKMCGPAEAVPNPAEPERPQGAALERSPSTDAGAVVCRARELGTGDARWAPRARGERRRHTITNGVDCDLLKQMKELEQEQEVLLQGLEMMARGREWYQQQLQRVQERQRRLGQSRASARLCQGMPGLPDGALLQALPSSSSSGAPCPALAPASPSALGRRRQRQQQAVLILKEQNRLLTQEVTDKSERITQLEQEKSALIKQLFEARALSQQDAGPLDSTFI
ncbi:suppressor APC domain-containing protein 2 isoform X2 [Camelus ferus]|uniref:Suppressor APC domain-containing protein 2 isoform X2 n=1 Tax=Camelus ferus TaxID=419612 RepID=A0A8B8SYD3_CAMFR|nr:suppressor APC domain-containing protein 2 isoform X2 [Camelus ferus]